MTYVRIRSLDLSGTIAEVMLKCLRTVDCWTLDCLLFWSYSM